METKPKSTISIHPDFTRIYLIRHGEVEGAEPKRYNGHRDVALNENGQAQMAAIAKRLVEFPVVAIYCSDLKRTQEGASILAKACQIPVYSRPALREKNFGAWEGLTYEEATARFPVDWEAWLADPAGSRPPGGETFREMEQRVLQELSKILKDHPGQEVIILSHGGTNRVILCHALQLDLKHIFRIEQKFAALNMIDFYKHQTAVVQLMNG